MNESTSRYRYLVVVASYYNQLLVRVSMYGCINPFAGSDREGTRSQLVTWQLYHLEAWTFYSPNTCFEHLICLVVQLHSCDRL